MQFIAHDGWVVGDHGTILKSTNGGITWYSLNSGTELDLYSVSFINLFVGWAVGKDGLILNSVNRGASWNSQTSSTDRDLNSVFFESYNGYAAGDNGTILKTTNSGAVWTVLTSNTSNDLLAVFSIGQYVWAAGKNGIVLTSADGGGTWMSQTLNPVIDLNSLFFTSYYDGWVVGQEEKIWRTNDGGATWTPEMSQTTRHLNSVFFVSNIGYAAGQNGLIIKRGGVTSVKKVNENIPDNFSLSQNYPNPFNPSTKIRFGLPKNSEVRLSVYDMSGREAGVLINGLLNAGEYEAEWNPTGLASGVYFYILKTADYSETRRMIFLK